ncbi:hypothetical protein [Cellulomonas shaoxiangyii]|uniref:DUF3515 family protein n=1 Tax=Cellulomonas shaoxiangyii TaxID=2566013 RepID=A0A4P7SIP4_9CELL|nr:hypothetical protein [Cellulomonas shaoxiangyii]QCB92946.1 hypothetical protein E5225_04610 [Cellulomonas shaoxiangyii]TGY85366.1 hypothetical protein E5226_06635 [Cellulomonas shaoxiangyii]
MARALLAAALVLPAAACSDGAATGAPAAAPVTTGVRSDASCLVPEVLEALVLQPDPAATASAGAVERGAPPDGFVADTVLVCRRGEPMRDSAGTWHSVTATRLEGDLTELLRLVAPGSTPGACTDGPPPQVWLVDALDDAVLLPAEAACTGTGDAVVAALDALDVVRRTEEPVSLAVRADADALGPGAPGARAARP